jgi:ABC-type multidrug transport system ATPase subunit
MIVVSALTKRFGQLAAVDALSFEVAKGQAVALWGANGAGKTTALRCLLGLLPFQGRVTIGGMDVNRRGKAVRGLVGFVPQELNFHDDLTAEETVTFYARLRKCPAEHDFTPLLADLGLVGHMEKEVGELSGGLKQRLALALALLSEPPILVLDEPTANLDIRAREEFLDLLLRLKQAGKTLVFSSHRFEEVTALADRVLLLEGGRLVVDAPPSQLARRMGWESTLHLYLEDGRIGQAAETLSARGLPVHRNGRGLRVRVAPGDKTTVLHVLHDAGIIVDDFAVE